jgi:hypothetical protein
LCSPPPTPVAPETRYDCRRTASTQRSGSPFPGRPPLSSITTAEGTLTQPSLYEFRRQKPGATPPRRRPGRRTPRRPTRASRRPRPAPPVARPGAAVVSHRPRRRAILLYLAGSPPPR